MFRPLLMLLALLLIAFAGVVLVLVL